MFAALTQLKNVLRLKWDLNRVLYLNRDKGLSNEDRQGLMGQLLELNVMHSNNYQAFKLIKDICSIVGEGLKQLLPIIFQLLSVGQELKSCLNLLLALAQSYRF